MFSHLLALTYVGIQVIDNQVVLQEIILANYGYLHLPLSRSNNDTDDGKSQTYLYELYLRMRRERKDPNPNNSPTHCVFKLLNNETGPVVVLKPVSRQNHCFRTILNFIETPHQKIISRELQSLLVVDTQSSQPRRLRSLNNPQVKRQPNSKVFKKNEH